MQLAFQIAAASSVVLDLFSLLFRILPLTQQQWTVIHERWQQGQSRIAPILPSRSNRVVLLAVALFLLFSFVAFVAVRRFLAAHQTATATIIAAYRADFTSEHPAPGWRYCWNPNGPVGDTNSHVPLVWTGDRYAATDMPLPAPPPAGYLRLSMRSGHPGNGSAQMTASGGTNECAVIIGFTLPEAGRYLLTNSFIVRHDGAMNGSVHLQVFVNDRDTKGEVYCRSRQGIPFDRELGSLSAGDTIYVSVGAGELDRNDSFGLDFAIGRY